MPSDAVAAGFTVADVAKRFRVSPDKIRAWIRRGELAAVNVAAVLCGRPRWVVTADAVAAFERGRSSVPPPKARKSRKWITPVDYYPD